MPAPVQPSELPYWNPPEDPNDVKNPGDAQAELGYKYKDKVPYGWLNWQWKRTYQWLLYLKNFVIDVFNIQHDPTTGFHTNITATDLIVSAGDFQVDADGNVECNDLDCGDVTSLGIIASGFITADNFYFGDSGSPDSRPIRKRYMIEQTIVGGTGTISVVGGTDYQSIVLATGETCRIHFQVPESADLDNFKVSLASLIGYDLSYALKRLDPADGTWKNVTGGAVTGSDSGAVVANFATATFEFPDTNSPTFAGQGVKIASGQQLLSIVLTNNHASNCNIFCYEFTFYVSVITTALNQ